jgi:copper chaperone NosL
MMKHLVIGVMVVSLIVLGLAGGARIASAQEDVTKHPSCPYCGMDRAKFAHSRVLVDYEDGSSFGACSLHCAAVDMAVHIDKTPKSIMVGDYNTKELIDAETATWVIGGNKMGVMSKRAKWAFESKEDADKFIKENGGKQAGFEEAIKASYEDMHEDTKMIRERRKEKRMKMMKPVS